jgi:hypothetical protein
MDEAKTGLALQPLTEALPEAVAFSPELSTGPAVDSIGALPARFADKVTIAPAAPWVLVREVEKLAETAATNPWPLMDWQFHAERGESYHRIVRRLDTISAVRQAGQWRVDFDPRHERLVIHSLSVMRGERRAENARLDRVRVLQRETGLESLAIHGLLTVVVLLEDVRPGDVLDLSYSVQGRSLIFPDHFFTWVSIPGQLTVPAFHFSARFAARRAVRWKSNDPKLAPVIREEAGEIEWAWRTTVAPYEETEVNIPARLCAGKWIQVSDFASWADVASGLAASWKEDLEGPEVAELAESIIAESGTTARRVERALTFLQDEVRYLSVSGDLGGTVPSAPGAVLRRRFGDCKDKAFAAAHLLRRLGVPARPVLVHTVLGPSVQEFLPMPDAFNHVIVEFELAGHRRWVDVTAPLQGGTALTRPGVLFQLGLPIGPGVRELEPIAVDSSADSMEMRETYFIDTSGRTSSVRIAVIAGGREADQWRRSMAEVGAEEFARSRERFFQRIFPYARRAGKLKWEDDRESNEFALGEVFDLNEGESRPTILDRKAVRFRVTAHTIQSALCYHQIGERHHPWALPFPCRIKHIIEIDSPSLRKPQANAGHVDNKAFRFSVMWQGHPGLATITYQLQTLKDAVPPEEFADYQRDVQEVLRRIGVAGNLPAGSAVAWRKRSPENVLPQRRSHGPTKSRGDAEEGEPFPTVAPACASPETSTPRPAARERRRADPTEPRQPGANPSRMTTAQRREIQRPNPTGSYDDRSLAESRSARRRARREARRRRRLKRWLSIGSGVVFLGVLLFAIYHRK